MKFDSMRDLVAAAISEIGEKGDFFEDSHSEQSVFQGSFKELLNYAATVEDPRARVLHSSQFNIGFAVARFMYLIRGVNTLEEIAFYAPRSADYSDDGKHLFGSSYGYKIFKDGRFWNMVEKLKSTESSKRLYIPIFDADDFLRDSKDIPCAVGFLLSPRKDLLSASLLMRANDAFRLLPYNLFEFSLLQECFAVASDMQLGSFGYYAGTLHLRGADVSLEKNPFEDSRSVSMNSVMSFDQETYQLILKREELLRNRLPAAAENYLSLVSEVVEGLDDFWKELFYILADYGYSKCHKKHPQLIEGSGSLYSLYRAGITS